MNTVYPSIIPKIKTTSILLFVWILTACSLDKPYSIDYFNTQKKGTNFFNEKETLERMIAAKKMGLDFIRLSPNKWINPHTGGSKKLGNFLIGNTLTKSSPSTKPNAQDIKYLKQILDLAQKANIKVILTMISLPHSRWAQHNGGIEERHIWQDFKAWDDIADFWTHLAKELKNHPALIAYNLRNEPSPEKASIKLTDWATQSYTEWYRRIKNTPEDLNLFYKAMLKAIRKVDKNIPIILESGFYASPAGFKILQALDDKNTLYSFHMYEPFAYTNISNKGDYTYPGNVAFGETYSQEQYWNKQALEKFLQPIKDFQKQYKIPNNRIIVSEFGVARYNKGADLYLKDLIEIFNKNQWHWAFYSFREDNWDAMDYELGDKKPTEQYWNDIAVGKTPDYSKTKNNKLIAIIKNGLK